ncbi:hypothetical protein PROH_20155 [Prochlorothrix hollandica PCC 9006 = CALU 1027]|uniref:Uncharacterized protein n=1 Tax=Prochlorothrix hollandica PCC 9006 = CALU 1027 TaxID=317619 RepID=A0A0M2PN73_PROHO|nr:hypothetical protein PROH_20155 [Prochlorothrix hollandica PCC 9006 = CALU 1027]
MASGHPIPALHLALAQFRVELHSQLVTQIEVIADANEELATEMETQSELELLIGLLVDSRGTRVGRVLHGGPTGNAVGWKGAIEGGSHGATCRSDPVILSSPMA